MSGLTLVYRSHYKGPLSKSIHHLEAESLLGWFQQLWLKCLAVETEDEGRDIVDAEAGVYIYGFGSIGAAIVEHQLEPPETIDDLRRLLHKHLYVEGGPESVLLDEHTLQCATNDDEVELAYYFFDAAFAAAHPERVAYLLQEDWRLPTGAAPGGFKPPVRLDELLPDGRGDGWTFAILLTFYDGDSLAAKLGRFDGVRVRGLKDHMVGVRPNVEPHTTPWGFTYPRSWPLELRLLRALIDKDDLDLGPALARVARYPLQYVGGIGNRELGLGQQADAAAEFAELALVNGEPRKLSGDPGKSLIAASDHLVQLCHHATSWAGYQQWFLFDDLWASANPALAASLLRYAEGWNVLTIED